MFLIDPSGRNRRLVYFLVLVGCLVLGGGAYQSSQTAAGLLSLVLFWVGLVNAIRRLHDTNHSGWFVLLNLIPIVNLILALYLLFAGSHPGSNRWGPVHGGHPAAAYSY